MSASAGSISDALRRVERALLGPEGALVLHQAHGRVERLLLRVDDELAVLHVVEVDRLLAHQRVHEVAAVEGEAKQPPRGLVRGLLVAGGEELQAPAPLVGIDLGPEAQRRVAPQQPRRQLRDHRGTRERRHVAVRELPPLAKLVSSPTPRLRSTTVTWWPSRHR
jgi:hypothetical protein